MNDRLALLVLGGGPAGLSAARAYRESGGEGAVAIVSDESRMPYSRPLLSKELLRGEASEAELAIEEEDWLAEPGVSLIAGRAMSLAHEADDAYERGRKLIAEGVPWR